MGQRKLTAEERGLVCTAFNAISELHYQMMPELYSRLSGMRVHGTSDGKPYVEPQPEIGDGYRLAKDNDVDRGRYDREGWVAGEWKRAGVGCTIGGITYRVPIDRIPTDLDARERPLVMVRDHEDEKWGSRRRLVAVSADPDYPFYASNEDSVVTYWRYCRFPYPGE